MVYLRQRSTVKWIGWIDVGLLILCIIGSLIFAAFFGPIFELLGKSGSMFFSSITINNQTLNATGFSTDFEEMARILWIEAGVNIAVGIIQIIAAILLINSTSHTREPQSAIKLVSFWLLVNFIVVVSYFIWRAVTSSWFSLVVGFIIRATFIFFVGQYFKELRDVTKRATVPSGIEPNKTNVTVATKPVPMAPILQRVEHNMEQRY